MKPACLIALALFTVCSAPAIAQQLLRTPDGHPDFQGVWGSRGLTSMERMAGASGLVVDDAEARKLADLSRAQLRSPAMEVQIDPDVIAADVRTIIRVDGQWRSSLIIDPPDGKEPWTPAGKAALTAWLSKRTTPDSRGPEGRPPFERCLAGTGRTPLVIVPADNVRRIVQTPDNLVIYTEEGGDLRIARIGGTHRPDVLASWWGDSTARWDGDVLVVDTVHLREQGLAGPTTNLVLGSTSHVSERFRLASPNEIVYQFTIDDPVLFTRPFTAEYSLNRTNLNAYEYGCAEGNYSLPGILRAARMRDTH
jgi:hypothetical protein